MKVLHIQLDYAMGGELNRLYTMCILELIENIFNLIS